MCRIMLIYGSNYDLILKTLNAFVDASEYDKYKISLGYSPSHKDGWGYVALSIMEDNKINRAIYYRSIDPVFVDNEGMYKLIDFIKENNRVLILLHSRAISIGSLNIFNTHPYHYVGKHYSLWFVHNGTMHKDDLVKILRMRSEHVKELSDSYLLGLILYNKINELSEEEIINAYRELSKYTKTAMNTIGLYYEPGKTILAVTSSYLSRNTVNDEKKINYYKLYELYGDELYVIASSTIADIIENLYHRKEYFINKLLYIAISYELSRLVVKKYEL